MPENWLNMEQKLRVLGLMSGTSLDGLDCCYAEFTQKGSNYAFGSLKAHTFPYPEAWKNKLKNAFFESTENLTALDFEFGSYLAELANQFIKQHDLQDKVDLIASHGHTIFHQPAKGITLQIGNGEVLRKQTGIRVINNFRITDVRLGGQGAPLVPVGDHYLFADYEACLNLGGFSNISLVQENARIAFDISPCNLPLNYLSKKWFNLDFDPSGNIASSGKINSPLLAKLNALDFYHQRPPKSLGFEWLNDQFIPLIEHTAIEPTDLLATVCQHIADQLQDIFHKYKLKQALITGGGAYNKHLIHLLKDGQTKIVLPDPVIIEFKEALIFGFLGYLNFNNTINTFKSVTGAHTDSIGGIRHF